MITPLRTCVALLFCLPILASARESTPASEIASNAAASVKPATGKPEGLIKFDVVVTDASGKPVTGLGPTDFTLLDNGKPSELATFQSFSDATLPREPAELILVLDLVDLNSRANTMKGDAVKVAAEEFLRNNRGKLEHPTSVYVLTKDGLSGSPAPSLDGNSLARSIAELSLPGRRRPQAETWFHTLPLQVEALGKIALEQRLRPARKVLIWTGPGWAVDKRKDDRLFPGIVELFTRLREARITVWGASQWPYPRPGEDPGTSLNPAFAEAIYGLGGWPALRSDMQYPEFMGPVLSAGGMRDSATSRLLCWRRTREAG